MIFPSFHPESAFYAVLFVIVALIVLAGWPYALCLISELRAARKTNRELRAALQAQIHATLTAEQKRQRKP